MSASLPTRPDGPPALPQRPAGLSPESSRSSHLARSASGRSSRPSAVDYFLTTLTIPVFPTEQVYDNTSPRVKLPFGSTPKLSTATASASAIFPRPTSTAALIISQAIKSPPAVSHALALAASPIEPLFRQCMPREPAMVEDLLSIRHTIMEYVPLNVSTDAFSLQAQETLRQYFMYVLSSFR